ncbi:MULTISPECIES: precorrin-2 dehydrogenase/sirohydrochlorin ferrochelatase family protein [Vibrio]|uniref:precorrin-2 dehydrogenase n=3 Tax=Vibrio cyclitrophicus TaxID=47951 RepID=A0A7Z1S286_9VIBR|nr:MULTISPECIES: bifunctional precorrin-2 dehydrogenase/sirohydrochlorin ferrochelatase [Vibrio]KNH12908.1 ferrochelatase [Vibrio lentus]ERM60731.1 Siroheme synthase / Precorrin-2 oxidase / Sirohydrochlorin ferrochelatase [Vibrio cyclitrophicus FF75]KAA8598829.1 Precorrin-2 oxidase Sirohydrochlorin ferrochelatase activity of CysG [Vibrio cyclitrophicus]MBE8606074.1 siroheme synthase [Vibrio sp. OPT10]MBU2933439.1 siroheme synthase [Vibrio cyclitrophicus]|tara:strand:- start:732 stop:1673 length:942 start_codon:yes stop_codon:yes gene_type:complete
MRYFPMFLDVENKPILVVGGGEVACRKVDSLLRAGANVTLVSPKVAPYLKQLVDESKLHWVQNFYSSQIISKDYLQVWATTDNPSLNHQVHNDAKKLGILVNVVDDLPYCDFITPSMINRGRIQIAISSGGASPVLVRNIREKLETILPQNIGLIADFGASKRNSIKESFPTVDERRKFWERFLSSSFIEQVADREQLEAYYQQALTEGIDNEGQVTWIEFEQDIELLPMKALRLMQEAELVLAPNDCPFEFVDLCRRDAERESYANSGELSTKLEQARAENLRVCVFIPPASVEFNLLAGKDLKLSSARVLD